MNTTSLYAIQYPDGTFYPRSVEINKAKFFHLAASAKGIITNEKRRNMDWGIPKFVGKMVQVDVSISNV